MRRWIGKLLARLSLVSRFRVASSLLLVAALVGVGVWIARMIDSAVIRVTSSTTALYMESIVAPQLAALAQDSSLPVDRLDALDRLLHDTAFGSPIVAFKIWGPGGRVLYATDRDSIGRSFPVEPRLARAWGGETTARISQLGSDENASERQISSELLETYSPVHLRDGGPVVAVAEFYQNVDELKNEINRAQIGSWLLMSGVLLGIYLLLVGFVERSGRTIIRQQVELSSQVTRLQELLAQNDELHERVHRATALTAAINERFLRRIGAELHDGPVQDLSLALLHFDSAPDDPVGLEQQTVVWQVRDVVMVQSSVSRALDEVRAISAGLGLPELGPLALSEVVSRVVQAHEGRTGSQVVLSTSALPEQPPLAVKITVYRIIQEALTNAYRHAGGTGQAVNAEGDGDFVRIEIVDSGPGFDVAQAGDGDGRAHLGLAGMRERVQSLGGVFTVESAPGRGTRIRASLLLSQPGDVHDGLEYT